MDTNKYNPMCEDFENIDETSQYELELKNKLIESFYEIKWYLIATMVDDPNDAILMHREDLMHLYIKQGRLDYNMDQAAIERLTDMERFTIFAKHIDWFDESEQAHCQKLVANVINNLINIKLVA
ncbi:hypothetical protein M2S00_07285 [Apilactobacillus sp. TMW 2.2459]|uniref:hypothetical protein n=1 Tax=Apilactobacillus xinyiensis TaxID=2841032 RepID=UPI00200DC841|nr:hypothetical protein [Apilactobacillus xinyiensis]MCL0312909.1 hypothetical protein [Apilactobacillus xinyiensis]